MRDMMRMLVLVLLANIIIWNICFADNKDNVTILEKQKVN
jgi:hypothetical protein